MYDADAYAPCRYHLVQRIQGLTTMMMSPAGGSNDTSAAAHPLPGTASRWRMPANATGLDHHAHMVHRVDNMYQTYTLYYLLQVREGRDHGTAGTA